MQVSIFNYTDYTQWLHALIQQHSERGFKAKLADAAPCQRSYLSQVLSGKAHLTADHALGIAAHLRLSPLEEAYLEAAVALAHAGTPRLRHHYQRRMKALSDDAAHMGKRLGQPTLPSPEAHAIYCSGWEYPLVHILLLNPKFRRVEPLAAVSGLTESQVLHVLQKLSRCGLAEQRGSAWTTPVPHLHLPTEASLLRNHHRNLSELLHSPRHYSSQQNLHYSAVFGLDNTTLSQLRAATLTFIEQTRSLIAPAPDSVVGVMGIDLISVAAENHH